MACPRPDAGMPDRRDDLLATRRGNEDMTSNNELVLLTGWGSNPERPVTSGLV
jgi:hypothetical protein